jgi:hypothetical protein
LSFHAVPFHTPVMTVPPAAEARPVSPTATQLAADRQLTSEKMAALPLAGAGTGWGVRDVPS